MKNIIVLLALVPVCLFWNLLASAQGIDVSRKYEEPIGQHIQIYQNKKIT